MNWYKLAQKNSLLSDIVTLYALNLLVNENLGDTEYYRNIQKFYADIVKKKIINRLLEATKTRTQRIADRITVNHGPREEELLESGILDEPQYDELREILYSGNISSYLQTPSDYKRFYSQLHSLEINAVYPRGERNNKPWINIVNAIIDIQNSSNLDLISQIDALKSVIHNVPESVLYLIPEGKKLIEFFDLTHGNNVNELYKYIVKHMDKNVINAQDLKLSLKG